jgi:hypothetical protein
MSLADMSAWSISTVGADQPAAQGKRSTCVRSFSAKPVTIGLGQEIADRGSRIAD